jgi:hypothetical protein
MPALQLYATPRQHTAPCICARRSVVHASAVAQKPILVRLIPLQWTIPAGWRRQSSSAVDQEASMRQSTAGDADAPATGSPSTRPDSVGISEPPSLPCAPPRRLGAQAHQLRAYRRLRGWIVEVTALFEILDEPWVGCHPRSSRVTVLEAGLSTRRPPRRLTGCAWRKPVRRRHR